MMQNIFIHIIDFIFPPKPEELELRDMTPAKLLENSPKALGTEFPFIKTIFSYKNPLIREMIWQIKYKKNKHCLKLAGFVLYNELIKSNLTSITLIPIPISKKRRRERGYNQAELIIDEIIKLDTDNKFKSGYEILIRNKDIEKQTFKNRNERIDNTKNIFKVIRPALSEQRIVIIDDVTTTGSTLKEARDELLLSGYFNVSALTIAH
jgi:ComF family protein